MRRLLIALVLFSATACAERWVRVPAPNFTIYTNAGDSAGREMAVRLEQTRKIFPLLIPRRKSMNDTAPLVAVVFKERGELRQVAPTHEGKSIEVGALFLRGEDRNYIVMDATPQSEARLALHEYAHFLLEMNLPRTPLWWDEGFADYYSTVKFESGKFTVGAAPPGYVATLKELPLPMAKLLATTPFSPEYKSMQHGRNGFYAQSWLLVHYLMTNQRLPQAMAYFDLTQNQSMPPEIAVQRAFGMTLKELGDAMRGHLANLSSATRSYALPPMEKNAYSIEVLKDQEARALIADVYLHSPDHQAKAEAEFRALLGVKETAAAARAGLGHVLLRKGQAEQAHEQFLRATELGSNDPNTWYLAAYSDFKARGLKDRESPELVELNRLLDEALKRDPSHADAMNLKALVISRAANPAEAIRLLEKACELRPRNEDFKLNLVNQYIIARRFEQADALLERLKRSSDPRILAAAEVQAGRSQRYQKSKIAQLAEEPTDKYTDPRWRPKPGEKLDPDMEKLMRGDGAIEDEAAAAVDTRPVRSERGTLLQSDCNDERVKVQVQLRTRIVDAFASDPTKVSVSGAAKFDCGWKNRRVTLKYRERSKFAVDLVALELAK